MSLTTSNLLFRTNVALLILKHFPGFLVRQEALRSSRSHQLASYPCMSRSRLRVLASLKSCERRDFRSDVTTRRGDQVSRVLWRAIIIIEHWCPHLVIYLRVSVGVRVLLISIYQTSS